MTGFNFGQIADIISETMDTDLIDIGRRMEVVNPDGSIGETRPEVPIYKGIKCNLEPRQIDNPNPSTSDTMPVNTVIIIHCPLWVDLQNGDYVYAHKLNHDGIIIETFTGFVGQPQVTQSRKQAMMTIRKA